MKIKKFREKKGPTQNSGKGGCIEEGKSARNNEGTEDPERNHGTLKTCIICNSGSFLDFQIWYALFDYS